VLALLLRNALIDDNVNIARSGSNDFTESFEIAAGSRRISTV
jgi:hypothetical protein